MITLFTITQDAVMYNILNIVVNAKCSSNEQKVV